MLIDYTVGSDLDTGLKLEAPCPGCREVLHISLGSDGSFLFQHCTPSRYGGMIHGGAEGVRKLIAIRDEHAKHCPGTPEIKVK